MTLAVNLVRTVSSAKFICCCWCNPWCDCHVTHTPKCNESAKIGQIINCGLTILIVSVFLCRLRITTQLRSSTGAVDKMAGILTKRIWQPYICQPNELKREIKKKNWGAKRSAKQKSVGPWPTQPPPYNRHWCVTKCYSQRSEGSFFSLEHTWSWEIDYINLKIINLTTLHPKRWRNVENKNISPVNIRFVAKTSDIRNFFENIRSGNTSHINPEGNKKLRGGVPVIVCENFKQFHGFSNLGW